MILAISALSANAATLEELEAIGISDKMKRDLLASIEMQQAAKMAQTKADGAFVTVGALNSCDYHIGTTLIQDAIDDGHSEIRIANDTTYTENLSITDISVTLKGGYADCTAADSDTQSGMTQIDGAAAAGEPVISISGATERHTIVLDSLILSFGTGTGFFPGGGISTLAADAEININNSFIANNTSAFGGGISINSGDTDFAIVDTLIFNNTAGFGGGIYCSGPDASILMSGNSGVSVNIADGSAGAVDTAGKGGGIYISDQCLFTSYSGTDGSGFLDLRGIAANNATDQGGGVFASGGATVNLWGFEFCFFSCIGNNTSPANLSGNRAESDESGAVGFRAGSGAFITGAGTTMSIYSGRVTGNDVGTTINDGGGIYADAGSTFITSRLTKACWDQEKCNYYADNASGSGGGFAGAFYNRESTMEITNTVIENNRSDGGNVLYTTGANAVTTIKGSLIYNNGDSGADGFNDNGVFRVTTDAELDIERSTIADNNATTAVFRIAASADAGTSSILASIVHDASSGDVYESAPGLVGNDCSMFHESVSIPTLSGFSVVDDPEFIDRINNDFHIDPSFSPALDYCDEVPGPTPVEYRDMDFEAYGFDDPTVANNFGPYDIGADETYANDIIFKDGFE